MQSRVRALRRRVAPSQNRATLRRGAQEQGVSARPGWCMHPQEPTQGQTSYRSECIICDSGTARACACREANGPGWQQLSHILPARGHGMFFDCANKGDAPQPSPNRPGPNQHNLLIVPVAVRPCSLQQLPLPRRGGPFLKSTGQSPYGSATHGVIAGTCGNAPPTPPLPCTYAVES